MNNRIFPLHRLLFLLAALVVFFACHLTNSGKTGETFDFPTLKATIKDADHAIIVLKDTLGQVIDTLFDGPVNSGTTFRGLDAPNYKGGQVLITIEATQGGTIIYQVNRTFDGQTGENLGSVIVVSPGSTVKLEWLVPKIREGDSVPLPTVKVNPTNLVNLTLIWSSRHPTLLSVTATHLKGLAPGVATLVISLQSDTAKKDSLAVEILSKTTPIKVIDSLRLTPDPLTLALGGTTGGRFTLNVHPPTASKEVAWISLDTNLLSISPEGLITPLAEGQGRIVAVSKLEPSVLDTAFVIIKPLIKIDSLRLFPDLLALAIRGPSGQFTVKVYPVNVSKEVNWTVLDTSILTLTPEGFITPKAEGEGRVRAQSKIEPTAFDTALVRVLPPQKVDSVRLDNDSLEIFVQGSPDTLSARVYPPLANPAVLYHSRDASIAKVENGKVQGLKEGETWVQVRSGEDPAKTDSVRIIVFPSQRVDSVRVKPDTLRLYVNGESLSLTAAIYPTTLQGRYVWRSSGPTVASVDAAGKVSPGIEGKVFVSALARADATQKDSTLVIVKKDVPQLKVGADTVVSAGTTVTHHPQLTQEYGLVVMFKWDLNGDGVFEDSSATIRTPLSFPYTEIKEYHARFYVRDTEGNDTTVVRKVKAVNGRVVQITSPKDGSYHNTTPITVTWTVDGANLSNSQALNPGANIVTRSDKDSAGKVYSHSITVHLDQTAPNRPTVKGSVIPVNTLTPQWTWSSGSGGGNGTFRYRVGNPDLSAEQSSPDTFYTASSNLSEGTHTLYVSERDEAGNWSPNGSFAIHIDTTDPAAPTLSGSPASPSRNNRPTWSWTGGVGDAHRYYRYKLGNDDFRSGGKDTIGTTFTPQAALPDTVHTLYVQERDSAGNWSSSASWSITIDTQGPTAPVVSVAPAALTNDETPTWTWTIGTGGDGTYRWKFNDANLDVGATETNLLAYTPATALGAGTFTLHVQVRDAAGNWSPSGSRQVRIDLTAPTAPRMDSTPYSPLNSLRPKWTWRSGTGGIKVFRAKVDNPDLNGVSEQLDSSMTPGIDLSEGLHSIYVQERDSAGNWSVSTSRTVVLVKEGIVGTEGFSTSEAYYPSIGFGAESQPTMAYYDGIDGIVVRKFNGSNWEPYGTHPISESGRHCKLAYGSSGIPHIAYWEDAYPANGVTVRKLNGNKWDTLGLRGEAAFKTESFALAINGRGEPLVAYSTFDYDQNRGGVYVSRFAGSGWTPYGGAVSDTSTGFETPSIALDGSETPYIAFQDLRNGGKLGVKYLSGANWLPVGGTGISKGAIGKPIIRRSKQGTLYVLFVETLGGARVSLMKYSEGNWSYVGEGGIPATNPMELDLQIDASERPVVAVMNQDGNTLPLIYLYSNSQWRSVGNVNANVSLITSLTLALNPNGVPYIGFADYGFNGKRAIVYTAGFE